MLPQVARWTAFLVKRVFDDEEPTLHFWRGQLEVQHADPEPMMIAEAILS